MQDNQREELIYLAGIFDGEGTIGINSRFSKKHLHGQTDMGYAPYVRIGMNDETSIRNIVEFFKVGHYYPEKQYKGYRAMHRWDCRNREGVKEVLLKLEPFLRLKRPQAQLALQFLDECMMPKNVRKGIPFTPEMVKKRYWFYLRMKEMNGVDISLFPEIDSPATTKRMGRPLSVRSKAIV